jgi:hypothetical protein
MSPPIVQSEPRHHVCTLFDLVLDAIIIDQDTGNSYAAESMRLEFGESLAAGIMRAAGIRRLRQQIDEKNAGTQVSTGAPSHEYCRG